MRSPRGLAVPVLIAGLTGLTGLAAPAAVVATAPAAGAEVPRVQTVRDPRGDVAASGSVPASVRRSVDVSSLQVRRDDNQLRLRLGLRDVRSFSSWEQGATLVFSRERRHQRFTVAGSGLLRGDPLEGRLCDGGVVHRKAGKDALVVRLPFACIRTEPGELLGLRVTATATPTEGDGGRAADRVRSVRTDPR